MSGGTGILAFFELPATAALAAVGAAAVPVVIHLLSRRRYRVVTWAAMRFLLAAQRKQARRLRLEQFLLLAVRTLIVLLLVAAMASVMPWAEPFAQALVPGQALLTDPAARRTYKILVLDGSLSMAARVGDVTCFDRARAAAARLLQQAPAGDGFSVVLMSAPPRQVVSQPADDGRKVADEIEALRLPHGNADLAATLQTVDDLLRQAPEKFSQREVYFLTDLQRATWTARQTVDPASALQKIQRQARTVIVDVGQDGLNNLAVTGLVLGTPLATTGAVTPITATVHNYGAEPRKQVRIDLLIGKARAVATDPPFALQVVQQEVADLAPGQTATVTFPYRFRTPGDYALQVHLEGDCLELDDSRYAVLAVADSVPVMLVDGKATAAEPYDRAAEWLKDALNPFPAGTVAGLAPARPEMRTITQFADVGQGDLARFDCVFLCDVPQVTAAQARRLETHLRRGGGVVFCLGPQVDLEAYNRLLYRNGDGVLPARLLGMQRAPAERSFSFLADEEAYKHPPLEAFAGDNDRASLTGARFREYVRVELPPRGKARKLLSFMPTPILSAGKPTTAAGDLPSGDPAVVSGSRYRGRVVLLTTTVNMDWSTWPISPSFPAFMQELLRYVVAGRLREQAALVGDPLEEYFPLGSAGLDVTLHMPDGRQEATRTQDQEEIALLRWTDTDASGIYRATVGRQPREYLFAVNVPAAADAQQSSESDLTRTSTEELQAAFPGWEFQFVTDPDQVVHRGAFARPAVGGRGAGTAVARYLLLTMLGLLLVEVILAWRFGHYRSGDVAVEAAPAAGNWLPLTLGAFAAVVMVAGAAILAHAAWTGDFLGFLPEGFRRAVESEFDVPPPTPGEGTRWRLEYLPYLKSAAVDPWLTTLLATGITTLVVLLYLRQGHTCGRGSKLLLAGFRIGFVLLTVVVLLPQLRLLFERQSWPDVAILIDDSRSMATADQDDIAAIRAAVERLLQPSESTPPSRLQLAQALLTHASSNWLETLLNHHQIRVHLYRCSGRAARIAEVTDATNPRQLADAVRAVQELRAEGDSSQLGTAVHQVLNDFRGSSLAAIIMLTDGITTEGEDLPQAARHAAQVGVPLFLVGLGAAHAARELRLHDLQADDQVYVNDRIVFEARVTGQGYGDRALPVVLHEKGKEQILETALVKLDAQGRPVKVRLAHRPTTPGEKVYVLEIPRQPEQPNPAPANQLERRVLVRESRLIRVLYVEGYARYEYRFLKTLLERESASDPRNKSVDLKVLLLDADPDYPRLDKSALAEFPSKLELGQYDVVLLGDVDPADPRLEKHLPDLADFMRERGGGLLVMAGERANPHAFKDSPLRDILPVEIVGPEPSETEQRNAFRPELTPGARSHPLFRFSPDEAENIAIWNQLPEMYWWSECYRAKPGAEILAVHPRRPALDREGRPANEGRHPLILQHFAGAGRCLFFGFDETWRWRFRENELHFNQFWIQAVRSLARGRLGRVELRLDRQIPYRRGEPIKISVRFPDDVPLPAADLEVKVHVQRSRARGDGAPEVESEAITLARVEGSRGAFEGLLTRTPEGDYQFWLAAPTVPEPRPRAECRVLAPPGELDRLRMNQADLERAAELTQGRFYTLATAEALPDDLPPGSRITLNSSQPPQLLWNHAAVYGLALYLLAAEWFLRKRKHLV